MPVGLFRRPGARAVPQAVASWGGAIPVASESELRAAVGRVEAMGGTGFNLSSSCGAEIVITKPISLGATVTIPPRCQGLTIRGAGQIPIAARGAVSSAFVVRAPGVSLRSLAFPATATANMFSTLVALSSSDSVIEAVTLDTIIAFGGGVADATATVPRSWFIHNVLFTRVGVGVNYAIDGAFTTSRIIGNRITGTNAIRVTATGTLNAIVGNTLSGGGGAITTNASAGSNTIAANTGTLAGATITAAGSDQVGLNA